jgi:aerobic carbon-monoxide dehydrogenase medium subunit
MATAPFEYYAPSAVDEALALLNAHGADAKPLAGGQSLIPMLALGLAGPAVVVDLNRLDELRGVRREGAWLRIGALVRHRALERGEDDLSLCPLLQEAAALIGNVRVRTMGTIGGSLAHADPAAELPAVVRALDGELIVRGPDGERTIAAAQFFTGVLTTTLQPGELLVAVRIPVPLNQTGYAVEEFSRRAGDFAIVAAVAVVELEAAGRVARARVAVAGAGSVPARLAAAEQSLAGAAPSAQVLRQAVMDHRLEIEPEGDVHASAAYRRHLTRVLAARALARAAFRASEQTSP